MPKETTVAVLSSQITYLREIQELLAATQTRLREGFVMDKKSYSTISKDEQHHRFAFLKKLLHDAAVDDQSIEDNLDFMLASLHKRIQLYKCIINNEDM